MDDAAGTHASTLDASMARARTITLIMAHNEAFRGFYLQPGDRKSKLHSRYAAGANDALVYLESLFPSQIGELCFIDRSGSENARVVHGERAPVSDLSPDEAENPFFRPTFALSAGQVFQSQPYVSPDTHDWVVGNATPIPLGAQRRAAAIVHYELSRRELPPRAARRRRWVHPAPGRRPHRPRDRRQLAPPEGGGTARGSRRPPLRGHRRAPRRPRRDEHRGPRRRLSPPCPGAGNANDWVLVAVARPATPGFLAHRPRAADHPRGRLSCS